MSVVYELEIELEWIAPRIWRRVRVSTDSSLADLHDVIQVSMGWEGGHLHAFTLRDGRRAGPPTPFERFGYADDLPEGEITVSEALPRKRSHLRYEYDFGDGWRHLVRVVESFKEGEEAGPVPSCVAGERACPPEDCGGPPGYAELLEILREGPQGDWDEERLEWLGDFDPEEFSLSEVQGLLSRYSKPKLSKKK